jgi:hypothetical protein
MHKVINIIHLRLGCRVVETTDVVVIKPTDSDIEKKISTILKGFLDQPAEK